MTDYRDLSGFFSEARYVREAMRTMASLDAALLRLIRNAMTIDPSDPECAAFYRKPPESNSKCHLTRTNSPIPLPVEGAGRDRPLQRDLEPSHPQP